MDNFERNPPLRGVSEAKTYNSGLWNVLVIGGSRGTGYQIALAYLERAYTVTFLVRDKSTFDSDGTIRAFIAGGQVKVVEGDALVEADVRKAWDGALKHGAGPTRGIDTVAFCLGGSIGYTWATGVTLTPHNIVTRGLQALFCSLPLQSSPNTKLTIVSSSGVFPESFNNLPWALRQATSYGLLPAHRDKRSAERLIAHVAGWTWDDARFGPIPEEEEREMYDGARGWREREGMPAVGALLEQLAVVRPLLLTDGDCMGDKTKDELAGAEPYRVETLNSTNAWSISRKDVAHFVVKATTSRWEQYKGSAVYLAY